MGKQADQSISLWRHPFLRLCIPWRWSKCKGIQLWEVPRQEFKLPADRITLSAVVEVWRCYIRRAFQSICWSFQHW